MWCAWHQYQMSLQKPAKRKITYKNCFSAQDTRLCNLHLSFSHILGFTAKVAKLMIYFSFCIALCNVFVCALTSSSSLIGTSLKMYVTLCQHCIQTQYWLKFLYYKLSKRFSPLLFVCLFVKSNDLTLQILSPKLTVCGISQSPKPIYKHVTA